MKYIQALGRDIGIGRIHGIEIINDENIQVLGRDIGIGRIYGIETINDKLRSGSWAGISALAESTVSGFHNRITAITAHCVYRRFVHGGHANADILAIYAYVWCKSS